VCGSVDKSRATRRAPGLLMTERTDREDEL
jgi:hypothetical protein